MISERSRIGWHSGGPWCGTGLSLGGVVVAEGLSCEWVPLAVALGVDVLSPHERSVLRVHIALTEILSFLCGFIFEGKRVVRVAK